MSTLLENILQATQSLNGDSYFDGEDVILLAMAVSDLGRDYTVELAQTEESMRVGEAVRRAFSGEWVPGAEIEERLRVLKDDYSQLPLKAIEDLGGFYYIDPRTSSGEEMVFDPLGQYSDLPLRFIDRFVSAHFSKAKGIYLKLRTENSFLGEINGKLNGTELYYFDSRWISGGNRGPHDQGFFLHSFFDAENHLVVWKTGKESSFLRDQCYTVVGGSVKNHDRYRDFPPKTVLTRAKFFDHKAGDML